MNFKEIHKQLSDSLNMPALGRAVTLDNDFLNVLFAGMQTPVSSLKVKLEDIDMENDCVTLAFAYCDENDNVILNVGRYHLRGIGSTLTLAKVANCLNFAMSQPR